MFKHPTEPSTPDSGSTTANYTAVGASDAIGYGSSNVCLPFAQCPNGLGYVQLIGKRLTAAGKTVTLVNLGLPGGVLSPGVQAIGNSLGRDILSNFLDSEVPFVPKNSTLVTVFAGGNDVNTIGAAVEAGLGGTDPLGYVTTQTQNFGRDLRAMVDGIKERAPDASGYSLDKRRWLQTIASGFSAQINALTSRGALVIDLMCDASFYNAGLYSSDGFHPNDAGYAHLADVVYPAASVGSSTAPRASCGQMTLY
jgi:lysophospholipase L1-like esterase